MWRCADEVYSTLPIS